MRQFDLDLDEFVTDNKISGIYKFKFTWEFPSGTLSILLNFK